MVCAVCGEANPESARFCGACGSPLGRKLSCPKCGAPHRPEQRFCHECGANLVDQLGPPPEGGFAGERKQVTVLFADVVGSMELAARFDAEEWRDLMERLFTIVRAGVNRFGGRIDKFTGDGVMALFGAPVAYEDHARRACAAALELRDDLARYGADVEANLGVRLAVRIGLNSGEVVTGAVGEDLKVEYTAVGDTVGLAQRLESLAAPGAVYMTAATARLVEGYFEVRALGAMSAKGLAQPVEVHELVATGSARTALEVAASRGLSRFVGREPELAVLDAAFGDAARGDARVIGVVADPGVGKSRLCHEFAERCRARGTDVFAAHALAHTRSVPFVPVLEMLRSQFRIDDQDDPAATRTKMAAVAAELDSAVAEILPLLFDFLGVADPDQPAPAMDPEARQRQIFAGLNRLRRARSARAPFVMLVEDLHWLDAGSEMFLENLVDTVPGTRVLVVTTFRPEYRPTWAGRSHYGQLPLAPLAELAIGELLGDLLGPHRSLDGVADLIRARTGGNPFFIEEVVRGLVEDGTLAGERGAYQLGANLDEIRIPSTVTAVLAARLDRLQETDKAVIQTAAVIGRQFSQRLLARAAGVGAGEVTGALRTLLDGELVYETSSYPEREFAFKHALVEEVAYGALLARRRAALHLTVAEALVDDEPEKHDERAALIARHFDLGGVALEAARWNSRAAGWAGYSQPLEAARRWRRVRALTAGLDASGDAAALAINARLQLLLVLVRLGAAIEEGTTRYEDEAAEVFAEAESFADAAEQPAVKVLALAGYGALRQLTDAIEEGYELNAEATRLADEIGDPAMRVAARHLHAWALFVLGRVRDAAAVAQEMVDIIGEDRSIGRGITVTSPYAWCRHAYALFSAYFDRVDASLSALEDVLGLEAEEGDWESQAWGYRNWAIVAELAGADADSAVEHALAGLRWADEAGGAWSRIFIRDGVATAYAHRGDWEAATRTADEALAIAASHRLSLADVAFLLAIRARARRGAGDLDGARAAADEAVNVAVRCGAGLYEMPARLERARVGLADFSSEIAEFVRGELDRALSLAERSGMRVYEPQIHFERARLARHLDDADESHQALLHAHRLFTDIGAHGRAQEVAAVLG